MFSQSPATEQFSQAVQVLLTPHNPHAHSLLAFISRTINQFELTGHITEIEIFVEAYRRGVRHTQRHQTPIREPKAWLRHTAYAIIREGKGDRQRYSAAACDQLVEPGATVDRAPPLAMDDEAINTGINSVLAALEALSPGDRSLIQWQVIEGLTWLQVQTQLVAQGEESVSQTALRQRGQHALERLRHAYHTFNRVPDSPELADDQSSAQNRHPF